MTAFIYTLWNAIKAANKRRVVRARLKRGAAYDLSARREFTKPEQVKRVLLVTTAEGWGDSLYVLGLCARLAAEGVEVGLIVPHSSAERFRGGEGVSAVIELDTADAPMQAAKFNPEMAIDLDYVGLRMWPNRAAVFRAVECYTATTSAFCRNANLFTEFVDLRPVRTVVERGAALLAYIVGKPAEVPVLPRPIVRQSDIDAAERWKNSVGLSRVPCVYVNAAAQDADRCFSFAQTKAMIETTLGVVRDGFVILYGESFSPEELARLADVNRVKVLPRISFGAMCRIVETSVAVVTPDTSVVHVASAYNTPTFAVYAPNDRDYFREYAQREAWPPLAEKQAVVAETAPNFSIDRYGYASDRVKPVSSYAETDLTRPLKIFLQSLN